MGRERKKLILVHGSNSTQTVGFIKVSNKAPFTRCDQKAQMLRSEAQSVHAAAKL